MKGGLWSCRPWQPFCGAGVRDGWVPRSGWHCQTCPETGDELQDGQAGAASGGSRGLGLGFCWCRHLAGRRIQVKQVAWGASGLTCKTWVPRVDIERHWGSPGLAGLSWDTLGLGAQEPGSLPLPVLLLEV